MIRSILLDRYALEDSLEIYFMFFWVVLYFLCIFEVYMKFWEYKRKQKFKTRAHSAGPQRGPASGLARSARPTRCVRCGALARAVTAHSAADPVSPADEVSWGRRREHRGAGGNTPDKVVAVSRQWRGRRVAAHRRSKAVAGEGDDEALPLEEETGEVRDGSNLRERTQRHGSLGRADEAVAAAGSGGSRGTPAMAVDRR
jgi:hypothetical protein